MAFNKGDRPTNKRRSCFLGYRRSTILSANMLTEQEATLSTPTSIPTSIPNIITEQGATPSTPSTSTSTSTSTLLSANIITEQERITSIPNMITEQEETLSTLSTPTPTTSASTLPLFSSSDSLSDSPFHLPLTVSTSPRAEICATGFIFPPAHPAHPAPPNAPNASTITPTITLATTSPSSSPRGILGGGGFMLGKRLKKRSNSDSEKLGWHSGPSLGACRSRSANSLLSSSLGSDSSELSTSPCHHDSQKLCSSPASTDEHSLFPSPLSRSSSPIPIPCSEPPASPRIRLHPSHPNTPLPVPPRKSPSTSPKLPSTSPQLHSTSPKPSTSPKRYSTSPKRKLSINKPLPDLPVRTSTEIPDTSFEPKFTPTSPIADTSINTTSPSSDQKLLPTSPRRIPRKSLPPPPNRPAPVPVPVPVPQQKQNVISQLATPNSPSGNRLSGNHPNRISISQWLSCVEDPFGTKRDTFSNMKIEANRIISSLRNMKSENRRSIEVAPTNSEEINPNIFRVNVVDEWSMNYTALTISITYDPSLSVQELVDGVSRKKGLNRSNYSVEFVDRFESPPMSATIGELDVHTLRLAKCFPIPSPKQNVRVTFDPKCFQNQLSPLCIKFEPDMTISQLKYIICEKHSLDPSNCFLTFPSSPIPCGEESTLIEIDIDEFYFTKKPLTHKFTLQDSPTLKFEMVNGRCLPKTCSISSLLWYLIDFPCSVGSLLQDFAFTFPCFIKPVSLFELLLSIYNGQYPPDQQYTSKHEHIRESVLNVFRVWLELNFTAFREDSKLLSLLLRFLHSPIEDNKESMTMWSLLGIVHRKLLGQECLEQVSQLMSDEEFGVLLLSSSGSVPQLERGNPEIYFTGSDAFEWMKWNFAFSHADSFFLGRSLFIESLIGTTGSVQDFNESQKYFFSLPPVGFESDVGPLSGSLLTHYCSRSFAQQLTLAQFILFRRVPLSEFMQCAWKDPHLSPHLHYFQAFPQKFIKRIVLEIVSSTPLRRRLDLLKHCITISKFCREINNYAGTAIFLDALQHPAILRLKLTWQGLSRSYRDLLCSLLTLFNPTDNWATYRRLVKDRKPPDRGPSLPFLAVDLQDLRFVESTANVGGGNLINFTKMRYVASILKEMRRMQSTPYTFIPIPSIQSALSANLCDLDDNELLCASRQIEPPDYSFSSWSKPTLTETLQSLPIRKNP